MREFKFRIWDKARKRMSQWEEMKENWNLHVFVTSDEDLEIMQFTGLKDRNGREIYEGDIVRCKYGPQIPMTVEWDHEYPGFRTFGNYDGDPYIGYVKSSCEVIGNIYQNPELR